MTAIAAIISVMATATIDNARANIAATYIIRIAIAGTVIALGHTAAEHQPGKTDTERQ